MTLETLFELCKDLELRQAKLYASLSLILGDVDERIARFWEKMSTEEWQHYILVDFGRALCFETFGLHKDIFSDDQNGNTDLPPFPDVSIQEITDALQSHENEG